MPMTRAEKLKLALSMLEPIRCEGRDYLSDGTSVVIIGGKPLTLKEFELYKIRKFNKSITLTTICA